MRLLVLATGLLLAPSACRKAASQETLAASRSSPDGACLFVAEGYGPTGTIPFVVDEVAEGLETPWGLAWLPGGDVLVTERPGRVRLLRADGTLLPQPVATLPVATSAESGLLGIALHPDFATTRRFFLYVTSGEGGRERNRLEVWQLAQDSLSAQRERVLLDDIPSSVFHDGGRLRVGPDRMLYVGIGDARHPDSSQDLHSPSGKLLRLTPEGGVPADNPFRGSPVFLSGLRNPQGFDWLDASTLVVTDHGPSGELGRVGHDEVNVAHAGDNLGWPTIWGCEQQAGLLTPVLTWAKAVPPGGAALYTGSAIAEWKGSLLVATLGSEHLHRVQLEAGRVVGHELYLQGRYGRLREAIMGPDGHLYLTTSNCDGRGRCPPRKDLILRLRR